MFKIKWLFLIVFGCLLGILLYNIYLSNQPQPEEVTPNVTQWRTEKDLFFINDPESPLSEEQKRKFKQLSYFPENPDYRVRATWQPLSLNESIILKDTEGSDRKYWKFGLARFRLSNIDCELLVLKPVDIQDPDYLFIPFYDETSALSTYGGGRYVEPRVIDKQTILIDFNMAYNPYCAYNENYSCPIPPATNRIKVAIKAGEKKFDL